MDRTLVSFFKPASWLAVYFVSDALCKTVMNMAGMLAIFLTQLSHLLCTVQPMREKKQPCTETELSRFFPRDLSSSLGTVRPFCYEKMRSAWTELSPAFFWDHFWIAFPVPPHMEITWHIAMISHPKGSILKRFWSHFGLKDSLVDPFPAPGTNLEARGSSRPKFNHFSHLLFGSLLDKFSFWGEHMLKIYHKVLCLCPG